MSIFKKGDKVRQIVPVIEGAVAGFQIDQEHGTRLILVDYTDADGNHCSRYFAEDHIEPVKAEETAAADAEAAVAAKPEESATGVTASE